jgi:hypothetical protein
VLPKDATGCHCKGLAQRQGDVDDVIEGVVRMNAHHQRALKCGGGHCRHLVRCRHPVR